MTNNLSRHWRLIFLCGLFALLALLAARSQVGAGAPANENDLLLFEAGPIDTTKPYMQSATATTRDGKALHIIQFTGPIQDAWLTAVEATGTELVHYVANYGYLVWAGESSRSQLEHLAADSDFLRFSAPYAPGLKSGRSLRQAQAEEEGDKEIVVTIQMLRHDGRFETEQLLDALIIEQLTPWGQVLNYQNMRALISQSDSDRIANLPDVVWIEAYQAPQLMDEKQAQILAGNLNGSQTMPAGPGYLNWLNERGFSNDPQQYPIIDITDDGIGDGNAATAAGDRTLRKAGNPANESRLAYLADCTAKSDPSGPDGHGHLNASIAGSFDTRTGDPYEDADGYQLGMGVNPFGRLAGTRVFDGPFFDISNCDSSYLSIVKQSYQNGARIVSNSWGCTTTDCISQYTPETQAYDEAVRDIDASTAGNQEMLILFSAGNAGEPDTLGDPPIGTVGSPANGKNVIAVGATENVRPTWLSACGYGLSQSDNVQDIARYSSRGPAPGERVKPDLVAPGTNIAGTASTSPVYNGSGVCRPYYPFDQQLFTVSTGTSHSAPAVAGFASLASFWLTETYGIENPSPALLKAFLIASSSYLTGEGAGGDLPSNSQGFGLPNMNLAFGSHARIVVEQGQAPLFKESGQSWQFAARPANSALPVRIVMTFTDYPGLLGADQVQVNDLNLEVQRQGKRYLGNEMDGQWSKSGGEADKVNNVEAVFFPAGKTGSFEITVKAANIAGDGVPENGDKTDQDFVLICDNCRPKKTVEYDYEFYFPILTP